MLFLLNNLLYSNEAERGSQLSLLFNTNVDDILTQLMKRGVLVSSQFVSLEYPKNIHNATVTTDITYSPIAR